MSHNDPISTILNLAPIEPEKKEIAVIDGEADYEYAKKNIKKIIDTGLTALEELASFANQAQHPRVYEVLSTHIKTMIDAQKDLLNLAKINKDIGDTVNNNQDNSLKINNAILVGSTTDLQKMLKELASNKTIEGEINGK
jgi:hypothetical protein